MALGILSVAVVLVPYHHALRIGRMQQRLRSHIRHINTSHTLALAFVGMLCAVRQPLTPIDCIFRTRYTCSLSGTATPTPAKS
jgi:hypothetical protein